MNVEGVAVLHDVTKASDAAAPAPALRGVMKVAGATTADTKEVGPVHGDMKAAPVFHSRAMKAVYICQLR